MQERERQVALLRGQQQRVQDWRAAQDELQARRYREAKERDWRQHEQQAAEKQVALAAELRGAREAQQAWRLQQLTAAIEQDRRDYKRIAVANAAIRQQVVCLYVCVIFLRVGRWGMGSAQVENRWPPC